MAEFLNGWQRSNMCAEVTKSDVGQQKTLMGWVQRSRNMGGIIFVWLRDRSGMIQLVFNADQLDAETYAIAESLRAEYVLAVRGVVALRDASAINEDMQTGSIEIIATEARILNVAETPPIYIEDSAKDNEAVRLKYRYLDLRKPRLQKALLMRAQVVSAIRSYMDSNGFVEIETPMLTKNTPEGAREFLVPSRAHPGECYLLPQCPQIYKQQPMLAGMDK